MKGINVKKLGLGLGAAFCLLAVILYGAYAYTLHRFQSEIDGFLEALVTEEDLEEFFREKEPLVNLDDLFLKEEEEPGLESGDEPDVQGGEEAPSEEPAGGERAEAPVTPGRQTPPPPPAPDPGEPSPKEGLEEEEEENLPAEDLPQSETKPPGSEKEPVEKGKGKEDEPQKAHAIFGSMPLKDQVYVISKISNFSLGELREFVDLYRAGGSSWCRLKERLLERLSEEEIQKLKALYLEYM